MGETKKEKLGGKINLPHFAPSVWVVKFAWAVISFINFVLLKNFVQGKGLLLPPFQGLGER